MIDLMTEKTEPQRVHLRIWALAEVLTAYILLIILWRVTDTSSLTQLDNKLFGWGSGTKILFLIFLPMIALKSAGRSPGRYGIQFSPLKYQIKMALLSLGLLYPLYCVFPILMHFGFSVMSPTAAPILSLAFLMGLTGIAFIFRKSLPQPSRPATVTGTIIFIAIIVCFLLITAITLPHGKWGIFGKSFSTVTYFLIATGFGEEIFFRGYIQSRLNESFGRPFTTWNTPWGWGLIITSLLFGIIHAFNPNGSPWWSVWTFFAGLLFGFLREKTGSVFTPAIVHGLPLTIGFILSNR